MDRKEEAMIFIKELAVKMLSQSNRATQDVCFMVYDTKKIWGIHDGYDSTGRQRPEETDYESLCELCKDIYNSDGNIPEDCDNCDDGCFNYYREVIGPDDRAGIFLTEEACQKHIDKNKHHYNNPIVYGVSFWRNDEMKKLINSIFEISDIEIPGKYSNIDLSSKQPN